MRTNQELARDLRTQASCIYLACEKEVADEIAATMELAATRLEHAAAQPLKGTRELAEESKVLYTQDECSTILDFIKCIVRVGRASSQEDLATDLLEELDRFVALTGDDTIPVGLIE